MCSLTAPSNRHNQPYLIFFLSRSRTRNIFWDFCPRIQIILSFEIENLYKDNSVLRWTFSQVWASKVGFRIGEFIQAMLFDFQI